MSPLVRYVPMVLSAALLGGCASGGGGTGMAQTGAPEMTDTQLAAYAATSNYPADARPADTIRVAAVVDKGGDTIRVYNFSDQPIRDGKVWVNKGFVAPIAGIPPRASVTIKTDKLYGPFGNSFNAREKEVITTVQLEQNGTLFDLMGPVRE